MTIYNFNKYQITDALITKDVKNSKIENAQNQVISIIESQKYSLKKLKKTFKNNKWDKIMKKSELPTQSDVIAYVRKWFKTFKKSMFSDVFLSFQKWDEIYDQCKLFPKDITLWFQLQYIMDLITKRCIKKKKKREEIIEAWRENAWNKQKINNTPNAIIVAKSLSAIAPGTAVDNNSVSWSFRLNIVEMIVDYLAKYAGTKEYSSIYITNAIACAKWFPAPGAEVDGKRYIPNNSDSYIRDMHLPEGMVFAYMCWLLSCGFRLQIHTGSQFVMSHLLTEKILSGFNKKDYMMKRQLNMINAMCSFISSYTTEGMYNMPVFEELCDHMQKYSQKIFQLMTNESKKENYPFFDYFLLVFIIMQMKTLSYVEFFSLKLKTIFPFFTL